MVKTCIKCGKTFEENTIDDPAALKYPSCPDCWKEWTTYAVMVMNEMSQNIEKRFANMKKCSLGWRNQKESCKRIPIGNQMTSKVTLFLTILIEVEE